MRQVAIRRMASRGTGLGVVLALLGFVLTVGPAVSSVFGQDPKGGEPKAESSVEARQAFADAANFQNNGVFDGAAGEWELFLKKYPNDPLAPKAQHYLGVCRLQLKEFDKAAAAFEAVVKNHPKFDLLEETLYNLASAQYSLGGQGKEGMHEKAAANFAELVKQFPKSKYAEKAIYYQGEALYSAGKKTEAIAAYEKLIKDFPMSKRRADAMYAAAATLDEVNKFPEAVTACDAFLKEFPEHANAAEIAVRKAAVLGRNDKLPEAGAAYAEVAAKYGASPLAADASILAGRFFYRAEKLDDAVQAFQKTIDAAGKDANEAAHWLARIYLKKQDPAKAAEVASKRAAAAKEGPFFVALLALDKRKEALAAYAKVAKDHASHELAPQALYNAAFTALELKDFAQGKTFSADFVKAYPQDKLLPDVQYVAAECSLQLKDYPAAEQTFAALVKDFPDHVEIDVWRLRWGLSLYLQKKYAETVAAMEKVVDQLKAPEGKAEAYYYVGVSQFSLDKSAEAEKALIASLAAAPKWRLADETLLYLARSQRKENKTAEAKKTLDQLIKDFPQSTFLDQAHYRLGEIAFAEEDYTTAGHLYDTVTSKWPDSLFAPYALYGKGWSQLNAKEYAPAVTTFTSLISAHKDHTLVPDTHYARAMARRLSDDYKGAIEDIETYLKSNPEGTAKADALYERGLAEVALKDNAAAEKTFAQIAKEFPKYPRADSVINELAWALRMQNKPEATTYFQQLVKDFPQSPFAPEAHFQIGEEQYDKKDYEAAVASYTASIAGKPVGVLQEKANHKLGWAHYQLKQYDAAVKAFSDQIKDAPMGMLAGDAAFMKAESLYRQDKFKEALPAFQAAAKEKLSSPKMEELLLLHAGQSAGQLKEWKTSLELLSQFIEKYPDSVSLPVAHYEAGWAKQNLGQAEEALKDYEIAATKSRDAVGARARFMMGELQFEKKAFEEAIREFQRAMFGYGGDNAPPETKNWQAKSGFEAGRCAEVQINEAKDPEAKAKYLADAKRFYTFVVEKHPQHELAAESKKRLEVLSKL
jgi:TolA-binding protein